MDDKNHNEPSRINAEVEHATSECNENDPRLLKALDEAIAQADASPGKGHSAQDVRARLKQWVNG